MVEFKEFDKIPRLNRQVVITEKLDGTNACVVVGEDGAVTAQSRTRIITPQADNYGFALWVHEHTEQLRDLADRHRGLPQFAQPLVAAWGPGWGFHSAAFPNPA